MSRSFKRVFPFVTACIVPAVFTVGMAGAQGVTLTKVSGQSPFASSTIGGPGTVYVNAEVEPWVDVNPTNHANIVGAWQQDRWADGGSHGLVAGYSFDGGKTFAETPLPFSSSAPGGVNYERASDPWVSFGPDGTLYSVSISFNQSNSANSVAAATSSNGGKTWGNVSIIQADTSIQYFNDKESVTADPVKAGTAYVVWDRLVSPNENPTADEHAHAYTGPALFSRTLDGGKTWSKPSIMVNTAENNQTIGNQIVVDPRTDTLYDFFDLIGTVNKAACHVAFVKSTDNGLTWSAPQIISTMNDVSVTDPNTGATIRTGDIIPEPAINPANGDLYVVWQDGRFSNGKYSEIALSTSTDGGSHWSSPVKVNTESGKAAFNPAIKVNSNGVIGVTYCDFRNLTNQTTTLPTDYWMTFSSNNGAAFGNEQHLTGPYDLMTAPYAEGYFVGDYQGLTSVGNSFYPFFVAANSGNTSNPTDVFTAQVTP